MTSRPAPSLTLVLALAALAGCASTPAVDATADAVPETAAAAPTAETTPSVRPAPDAIAKIEARSGSSVAGEIRFFRQDGRVLVEGEVTGLTPGPHGFHLHDKGDCSAPDGSSAGGHWNPTGAPHGAPGSHAHHAGDLGNLEAGADGRATVRHETSAFSLDGEPLAVGRAVIVHEKADDLATQPTGNAGGRVGCGVVVRP